MLEIIRKPKASSFINDLEKINQIIDLCIDRELYDNVCDILGLSLNAQKDIDYLCFSRGNESLEKAFSDKSELPVEHINISIIPSEIHQLLTVVSKEKPLYSLIEKVETKPILKYWSDLFWAKRIRAELLRNNKGKWLKKYEELNLFLESRMPFYRPQKTNDTDFNLVKFNFLMELSAVAVGEASFGYAERARHLLNIIFPPFDPENKELREPYERWIWWNMGMANQHMVGRENESLTEFNLVISRFFQEKSTIEEKLALIISNDNYVLEYLMNILPATLQRAAINLKQQLGYHALQALVESDLLLKEVSNNIRNELYEKVTLNLKLRIDLYRLEAYQQLSSYDFAKELLEELHSNVFSTKWKDPNLPPASQDRNGSVAEIQLVEQSMAWSLRRDTRPGNHKSIVADLKKLTIQIKMSPREASIGDLAKKADTFADKFVREARYLNKALKVADKSYWKWINGNPFDERIYFSTWAQFLKIGITASYNQEIEFVIAEWFGLDVNNSIAQKLEKAVVMIFDATIKLYLAHRSKIPIERNGRKGREGSATLELERFRSDDMPIYVRSLSSFYRSMSKISRDERWNGIAEKSFGMKSNEVIDLLKKDHFQLLTALDEYEVQFGEHRQINSLKRCIERLIWCDNSLKNNNCYKCLEIDFNAAKEFCYPAYDNFDGLLSCQKRIPRNEDTLPFEERGRFNLQCSDYEIIMREAENHLTKHLTHPSLQKPKKRSIHFLGLQRWNSLTPAQGMSIGGGYFIYRTKDDGEVDLGIAIDPGFDYVRNLFRMGFSLMDIDIVLISHAHPDHIWDFETIVQLLHELKGKKGITHGINVVLTIGSYQRLSHIINNHELRRFINPLVIDSNKEIDSKFFNNLSPTSELSNGCFNQCFAFFNKCSDTDGKTKNWLPVLPSSKLHTNRKEIEIWPTRAYHDDFYEKSDSFGFRIKFEGITSPCHKGEDLCFGYTGDTKWVGSDLYNEGCPGHRIGCEIVSCKSQPRWKDIASQYAKCDVLLMHLGSLIDHKNREKGRDSFSKYSSSIQCEELIRQKNHPYLMGMIRFLREIHNYWAGNKKLILIGEFGEELRGGIRTDLVKRLRQGLTNEGEMLPVDVGLDIILYEYAQQTSHSRGQADSEYKFLCALCEKHHRISEVDYHRYGPDEAIFYICKTCGKARPSDVRDAKLAQLYSLGREMQTNPYSE